MWISGDSRGFPVEKLCSYVFSEFIRCAIFKLLDLVQCFLLNSQVMSSAFFWILGIFSQLSDFIQCAFFEFIDLVQ